MKQTIVWLVTLWVFFHVCDIQSEPTESPSGSRILLSKMLDIEELNHDLYDLSVSQNQGKMMIEFEADRKGVLQSLRGVYLFRDQSPETLWIPLVTPENGISTNTTTRVKLTVPCEWSENLSLFLGCKDIRESGTLYGVKGQNAPFSLAEIPSVACIDSIHIARMIYDSKYWISLNKATRTGCLTTVFDSPNVKTNEEISIRIKR